MNRLSTHSHVQALRKLACAFIAVISILSAQPAIAAEPGVRIKDLANVRGARSNQLIGFGLVVGLRGTGDSKKSLTTNKAIGNMLTRLGMRTDGADAVTASVAAVVVTAELPAFSRNGDRFDLRVSTVGDSISLAGGTLVMTPLKAGDSETYAVGQGAVIVGQASGSGPQVLTVANVPTGGVVEREHRPELAAAGLVTLSLKTPDFTTSSRVAERINSQLKGFFASAKDPVSVEVKVPGVYLKSGRLVEFVSLIEGLKVETDSKSIVVINERTGTVVMGSQVIIDDVTVAHGELSIQVASKRQENGKRVVQIESATVGKLVETLNSMGVKPADLVGILQAVHAAGALKAELKFM